MNRWNMEIRFTRFTNTVSLAGNIDYYIGPIRLYLFFFVMMSLRKS